jgi:selenocysteine-specific elongation factor
MKSVIVGTAGHIDHGKTALVRALTGIDTDRLEEEKRRGITIELGFAHMTVGGPEGEVRLGFVDVPGHERFVRNMLAGVGGMDLVLFVISAEDSIKPQTREHFDICRLLKIPHGITVLTKCDLVDAETRQLVRMEAEEFVRGSFLDTSRAAMVEVSVRTGEGLEILKQELAKAAAAATQKNAEAPFRLPVDRVFTMKGFGTVVTGTLISGRLRKEDEIEVLPLRRRVRVRGLQVHGSSTEVALAGQRTAVNLAGVAQEELERGMTLAERGLLLPTRSLDVRLTMLEGAPALKNHSRVRLHLFTAETIAEVALLEGDELRAGASGWAQLRTASPVACAPGDRFIVRRHSPVTTIGGGVVADVRPMRKMKARQRAVMLEQLCAAGDGAGNAAGDVVRLGLLVGRRDRRGLSFEDAIHETGWAMARLKSAVVQAEQSGEVRGLGALLIATAAEQRIAAELRGAVERFQNANPLAGGISKQELLEKSGLEREIFSGALERMVAEKKLVVTGEQVHVPGRGLVMQDEEVESKRQIESVFATAGLKVPALKDALAEVKLDLARAQKLVTLLLREAVLIKIGEEMVFHQKTLDELKRKIREYKSSSPKIDVAQFKELTGVSRKYAIPLLEYLDREHVTRRAGEVRIIL